MIRRWLALEKDSSKLTHVVNQGTDLDLLECLGSMDPGHLVSVVTYLNSDGDTVLHLAAVRERTGSVRMMLNNKAGVNIRDGHGRSPLYTCLCHNSMSSARLLVNFSADVNEIVCRRTRESILHRMIKGGRLLAVELLLNEGAQLDATTIDGDTPLHIAARHNRLKVAQLLITMNAKINALNSMQETPLHVAVANGSTDVARALLKNKINVMTTDKDGKSALHVAVANSNLEITRLILAYNSTQVNSKEPQLGRTPLVLACSSNTPRMASLLLLYGADVNLTTHCRKSALHVAACSGNAGFLDTVLKHAPNINAVAVNNKTPLHFAAMAGHNNVVNSLLKAGVNVNMRDIDGNTALHLASHAGHHDISQALLKHGARINAINIYNQTALHLASLTGHKLTISLLAQNGCDPDILDAHGVKAGQYLEMFLHKSQKSTNKHGQLQNIPENELQDNFSEKCLNSSTFNDLINDDQVSLLVSATSHVTC